MFTCCTCLLYVVSLINYINFLYTHKGPWLANKKYSIRFYYILFIDHVFRHCEYKSQWFFVSIKGAFSPQLGIH